jgi:hypothetical protein
MYIPRLTEPTFSDKNWLHTSVGGYNECIIIADGSCIPNCVGYSWGRWRELLGKQPTLSRGNAEDWFNYNDGYGRSQTPNLGSVICWEDINGSGHVAIIEEIKENGNIICSNSAYGGSRFYLNELSPPNYYMGSGYNFQGFILFEGVPQPPQPTPTFKKMKFLYYMKKF